jgi:hypothetical protein
MNPRIIVEQTNTDSAEDNLGRRLSDHPTDGFEERCRLGFARCRLQLISRDQGRRLVQFWSLSPGTCLNSRSLLVTRVSPADLA